MIVEDDPVLARLLEHALRTRGYRTRWIDDGVAAAAELGAARPELMAPLLLLDWDLPGLDGLRVLRRLRERGVLERMHVIMLTARGAEGEVLEALQAGAVDLARTAACATACAWRPGRWRRAPATASSRPSGDCAASSSTCAATTNGAS